MPNIDSFKKPDGSIDMKAYNEAAAKERELKKDKGEICYVCGRWIFTGKGYPQECDDCKAIKKDEELHSNEKVRCPDCGRAWRVGDGDYYELYNEGTHDVTCPECDADFEVRTWVQHTFVSPARKKT